MEILSDWRLRVLRDAPPAAGGRYVLYWMIGARRPTWNLALDRAVDWADQLGLPLVVLEALRADYRWASDRFHRFVLDGMRDNAQAFAAARISYHPYLETAPREGRGLLQALAADAAVVVTDRTPVFDLAGVVESAVRVLDVAGVPVRFEAIDGYGIVPLDAPATTFPTAYAFRRYLQRALPGFLETRPRATLLNDRDRRLPGGMPAAVTDRWPAATRWIDAPDLSSLVLDHDVTVAPFVGGEAAGRAALATFVSDRLDRYVDDRSHPDEDLGSNLSPYLHFGQLSSHEVVWRILDHYGWTPDRLSSTVNGAKEGWWGLPPAAEAFLDQVITWRELGGNASRRDDYTRYESLPSWAQATLQKHASDPRLVVYTLDAFDAATTHDPIWNAAQRQLAREGRLHNYMRMLWGKKILEWTASPREALDVMVELNNRYALDGRDPNSYSGIFWVLGRYDRPWGPERPIFGTIRYMTSDSAARKLRLKQYVRRYGETGSLL